MLELVVPEAATAAIQAAPPLRESLPPDYLYFMGIAHTDSEDSGVLSQRERFKAQVSGPGLVVQG